MKKKNRKLVKMVTSDEVDPASRIPGLNEGQTSQVNAAPPKSKHAAAKKKRCRFCRKVGHVMEKCREWTDKSKLCYKCGSAEHGINDCKTRVPPGRFRSDVYTVYKVFVVTGHYPFAKCFICGEVGHLSKTCSQNPRGLYPEG